MGGVGEERYSDGGQLHTVAALLIDYKAGCASLQVWTPWRRKMSLALARNCTTKPWLSGL